MNTDIAAVSMAVGFVLIICGMRATIRRMNLRLHHVNVCSDDIEELHRFYSEGLGLELLPLLPMIEQPEEENDRAATEDDRAWKQNVGLYDAGGSGELQIHASRRQAYLGARMGHAVNPLITDFLLRQVKPARPLAAISEATTA